MQSTPHSCGCTFDPAEDKICRGVHLRDDLFVNGALFLRPRLEGVEVRCDPSPRLNHYIGCVRRHQSPEDVQDHYGHRFSTQFIAELIRDLRLIARDDLRLIARGQLGGVSCKVEHLSAAPFFGRRARLHSATAISRMAKVDRRLIARFAEKRRDFLTARAEQCREQPRHVEIEAETVADCHVSHASQHLPVTPSLQ
jgi:hypothetical protein